jgi:hypothetical protein
LGHDQEIGLGSPSREQETQKRPALQIEPTTPLLKEEIFEARLPLLGTERSPVHLFPVGSRGRTYHLNRKPRVSLERGTEHLVALDERGKRGLQYRGIGPSGQADDPLTAERAAPGLEAQEPPLLRGESKSENVCWPDRQRLFPENLTQPKRG